MTRHPVSTCVLSARPRGGSCPLRTPGRPHVPASGRAGSGRPRLSLMPESARARGGWLPGGSQGSRLRVAGDRCGSRRECRVQTGTRQVLVTARSLSEALLSGRGPLPPAHRWASGTMEAHGPSHLGERSGGRDAGRRALSLTPGAASGCSPSGGCQPEPSAGAEASTAPSAPRLPRFHHEAVPDCVRCSFCVYRHDRAVSPLRPVALTDHSDSSSHAEPASHTRMIPTWLWCVSLTRCWTRHANVSLRVSARVLTRDAAPRFFSCRLGLVLVSG